VSAKIMLGAMVTASVLAVAWGARDRSKPAPREARAAERPWLSKEAAAQIVGDGGTLGPLFGTLTLGGLAPTAEERARIEAFADKHDVSIRLETQGDELRAIRFSVEYGGCCGYEGAEVLALRAHRPSRGGGCMGGPSTWVNHWALAHDDGTYLRASVEHNKATFRWEQTLTTDEVLARAEQVFLVDTAMLADHARDRWSSLGGGMFVLEVPYDQGNWESALRSGLGFTLTTEGRRVNELSIIVRSTNDRSVEEILKARWGRPTIRDEQWTWRKGDRVIEASLGGSSASITMRRV
jgi:hypothetical protein